MADLISFDPYLGWVDVEDVENIPQDTRLITAADLIRYEKFGQDAAARINELATVATDENIALLIGGDNTDTAGAVAAAVAAALAEREQFSALGTNKSSDSILQTPSTLTIPVTALSVWELDLDLFYGSSLEHDVRLGWAIPAGSSGRWGISALSTANTLLANGPMTAQSAPIQNTLALGGNAAATYARVKAVLTIGATAGNIALTYAPDVAGGTVTLYQHSILRARRLS